MKKTSKKGFTIVELVIVIAVVAILAAVLIPTFVSITKKANESKDTQLVRNLNTALATDVGVEHETMTSALNAAAKAGYDVAKINTSATDNEILWDSANDVFCYRKDGKIQYIPETSLKIAKEEVKSYQYWIISSTVDSKYSTYLRDGYEGEKIENLTTGLDVGNNTGITEISYNRSSAEEGQTVVIRTNGGTLNINAPRDTVHHYDYIKILSVDAVSSENCYHEHGFVGELAKFTSGKFVAASTAEFHQTRLTIEETIASAKNATFEDLGVTYGSHHFSDGSCTVCEKGKTDVEVVVGETKDLIGNIQNLGSEYDGTVKYSLGDDLVFNENDVVVQPRKTGMLLDLKGHTLTLYNSKYDETEKCFTNGLIVRGYFEVYDSSAAKTGKIIASSNADNNGDGGLITVEKIGNTGAGGKTRAELVLSSGTIDSTNNPNGCAVMMWNSGAVTINGGTIKAKSYAISGTKYDNTELKSKLVINGGSIVSEEKYAIYHPQCAKDDGKFEINGGELHGKEGAIYIGGNSYKGEEKTCKDSGSILVINGGKLASDSDHVIYVNSTYLVSATACRAEITINGGNFRTENNEAKLIKVISTKGIKTATGTFKNGSKGFICNLKGGTFINVSQDKFIYTFDYTSATATKEATIKAKDKLSNKFAIENNTTDGGWYVTAK